MSDEDKLEEINENVAHGQLKNALEEAGVNAPEVIARGLRDRVEADLSKGTGPEAVRVLTEDGNRKIGEDGEPVTVAEFARQFAEQHPALVNGEAGATDGEEVEESSAASRRETRQQAVRAVSEGDIDRALELAREAGDLDMATRLKMLKLTVRARNASSKQRANGWF